MTCQSGARGRGRAALFGHLRMAGIEAKLGAVANAALLVGAILMPTLLGGAVIGAARLWRRFEARDRGPVPMGPPIEHIAADVRRLRDERGQMVSRGPGPGRGVRSRALNAAYVDALTAACRALGTRPPETNGSGPTAMVEIRRVESELRIRGLDI
jgi:hypothetical protein